MKLYLKPLVTCCLSMLLAACSQTRAEPTKLSTNTMPAMSISQPETPKSILVTKTPTPITVTLAIMETETLTVEKLTGTLEPTSTIKPLLPLDADAIRGEILFSIYPEGDIGLVKADGTGMEFLLQTPNNQMINVNRHAQWLPDGQHFSFTVDDFTQAEIWMAQIASSNIEFLLGDVATNSAHTWSPDGQSIAYVSTQYQIMIYNLEAQTTFQLTDDNFRLAADPAWSPDGTRIAFSGIKRVGESGNQDIYTVNPDGTNLIRVTSHESVDQAPSWSPASNKIAFSSTRDGDQINDIFFIDLNQSTEEEGNIPQQLTFDDTLDVDPDWSSDGEYLVYAAGTFGADHAILYIIDNTGARRFQLTDKNIYLSPQWQP